MCRWGLPCNCRCNQVSMGCEVSIERGWRGQLGVRGGLMGLDDLGEGKWASTSFEIGSLSKIAKATCRELVWNKDEFCFSSLAFGSPFPPPPLSFFFFSQHSEEKRSSQVYKHFYHSSIHMDLTASWSGPLGIVWFLWAVTLNLVSVGTH